MTRTELVPQGSSSHICKSGKASAAKPAGERLRRRRSAPGSNADDDNDEDEDNHLTRPQPERQRAYSSRNRSDFKSVVGLALIGNLKMPLQKSSAIAIARKLLSQGVSDLVQLENKVMDWDLAAWLEFMKTDKSKDNMQFAHDDLARNVKSFHVNRQSVSNIIATLRNSTLRSGMPRPSASTTSWRA